MLATSLVHKCIFVTLSSPSLPQGEPMASRDHLASSLAQASHFGLADWMMTITTPHLVNSLSNKLSQSIVATYVLTLSKAEIT